MANKIPSQRQTEFTRPVKVVVTNAAPAPTHQRATVVHDVADSRALNEETSQLFKDSGPSEVEYEERPPAAEPSPTPTTAATTTVASKSNQNSTQNTLEIAEIRDGLVIMNDGSFRAVLMVKAINFDLMSQQEQEAVEYSYQSFLNSLYFPIQVLIRSHRIDLQPYIDKLGKIHSEQDNMLLALLMEDYIEYIGELSQQTNIMDKKFYVVIPFFLVEDVQKALSQSKDFFAGLFNIFSAKEHKVVVNEVDLENAKTELRNRVQSVLAGLQQCGIQGLPLDTQELIELYYDTYNPDTATYQQLKGFNNLDADVIEKGEGLAPQSHLQGGSQ